MGRGEVVPHRSSGYAADAGRRRPETAEEVIASHWKPPPGGSGKNGRGLNNGGGILAAAAQGHTRVCEINEVKWTKGVLPSPTSA